MTLFHCVSQAESAALEAAMALRRRQVAVLTVKRARLDKECSGLPRLCSRGRNSHRQCTYLSSPQSVTCLRNYTGTYF